MLQGDGDVSEIKITRPCIVSEVMDIKLSQNPDKHVDVDKKDASSNFFSSSSLPSNPTRATATFTSITSRSNL